MDYMEYLSNSQIEEILWSFTRGRRGSPEFYAKIEEEFIKRMKTLKPRGVAFSFYEFSLVNKGSKELVAKYEEYISENIDKFDVHYLVKILNGLRKRDYDEFSEKIMTNVLDRVARIPSKFKINDVQKLLSSISGYLPIHNKTDLSFIYEKIMNILPTADYNPEHFTAQHAANILYHFITNNQGEPKFIEYLLAKIGHINNIPKPAFCNSFYSYTEMHHPDAPEFLNIVEELCKYGQIKYFFDHDNFIRMIWSVATLINLDPKCMEELPRLGRQDIKEAMFDINPNTLLPELSKMYYQSFPLIMNFVEFDKSDEKKLYEKLSELNKESKDELVDALFVQSNPIIRDEVYAVVQSYAETADGRFELVRKLCDEFYNSVDIAAVEVDSGSKVAILLQSPKSYLKCKGKDVRMLGQWEVNKRIILKSFGWKVVEVDEEEWMRGDKKENEERLRRELIEAFTPMRLEKGGRK
jgi:hypothetical protein